MKAKKNIRNILFWGLFLEFISLAAFSQTGSRVFINFSTRQGLPSNEVHRVAQDNEGYIWLATDFGLSRYDGYSFKNYGIADGMPENSVLNLFKDQNGKIWFNTFGASIGYIDHQKVHTIPMNKELRKKIASPIPSSFYTSNGDTLYYAVNNNSGYFRISNNSVEHLGVGKGESSISCFIKKMQHNRVFYYMNYNDINQYPSGLFIYLNEISPPIKFDDNSNSLRILYADNFYYMATRTYLYKVDSNREITGLKLDNPITCFKIISSRFYIGKSKHGLEIYDGDPLKTKPAKLLNGLTVTDVELDFEGGMWITTLERGVFYCPNQNIYELKIDSIQAVSVTRMALGNNNRIFAGTFEGDLYEISDQGSKKITSQFMLLNNSILSIYFDSVQNLLVTGTYSAFSVMKENKCIYRNDTVGARFFKKDNAGKLWGGNSDNIYYYNNNRMVFEKLTLKKPLRVFDILQVDTNRFLATTIEGLFYIVPNDTIYKIHESDSLNTIRFTCLKKLDDSTTIAGTRGQGLVILQRDRYFFINESNGLSENSVQDILVEGKIVYAATNNGVSKIEFATPDPTGYHIRNFSNREGYMLNKVNTLIKRHQYLYTGSEDGIFYFNPDSSNFIALPPNLVISDILINNKTAGPDSVYDLSYLQNNISIRYTGISPRSQGQVSYLYRLLPDDKKWHSTNQREINFSSLAPNNYTFECLVQNAAGTLSLVPVRIHFVIHSPWWKTWWFRVLFLGVIIVSGYFIFAERFKRKYLIQQHELEQVRAIEAERHRIAADMHDDLGTDLTNLVLASERMLQQDYQHQGLIKINEQSSELIDKLSQIIWAMNPAYDYLPNLTSYLTRFTASRCEENNILFELVNESELPPIRVGSLLRRNIFLIVKETLNNCIKHSAATKVILQVSYADHMISLTLKDDGKGFSLQEKLNAGNGISNLYKRAQTIKGELRISSTAGLGTEATLKVKVKSAA